MRLHFTKMNGSGNDFVLVDDRAEQVELDALQVQRLCDRQAGIGADGILLLRPCRSGRADWAWAFFNSDGSGAEMCGNGARCFARFVQRVAGCGERLSFETGAGVIQAVFQGERVSVELTPPEDMRLEQKVGLVNGLETVHYVNTGVPHVVMFVEDADRAMVRELGREIRRHAAFAPKGTNVNFVEVKQDKLRVRTYERGVEGETLACGTGVSASAVVAAELHGLKSPVQVQVQGGDVLEVSFRRGEKGYEEVWLSGPADFVFEGWIEV